MSLLNVENIRKSYGKTEVLKDISFSLKKGEVLAIIGSSGSGKTTLLRCLNFLETPSNGKISVNDKVLFDSNDSSAKSDSEIRKRRLHFGLVFQSFNLFPQYTVIENIMLAPKLAAKEQIKQTGEYMGAKNHKDAQKIIRETALSLLEKVGLSEKSESYPCNLSGGQQQRVAIARALATNPKILLCDEATSALDPTTTKAILALLKEINEKYGITIVIITHEMAVVQEVCTHVAIIDEGNLAEHGTVEEVFSRPKSKAARKLVFQGEGTATYEEMKGKRCIRIVFSSNSSYEPVIANMILTCKAPVNILLADTRDIGGVAHGQMILQLPEEEAAAEKMIQYLKNRKLEVEELTNYVG